MDNCYMLAIIPARGGSKGIPKKNIIEIGGKPLIAYSIESALEAKSKGFLDKVIVSTDDVEIKQIAELYGADVPFLRPASLATDKAKSIDFMLHAYKFYFDKGVDFQNIILLQPTSPLRTCDDIVESIKIYRNSDYDSLISCYKEEYICDLVTYMKESNYIVPLNPKHNEGIQRQEIPDHYVRNGAIYISKCKWLRDTHKVFGGKMGMYEMEKERSVNIDTYYDLELAKWLLERAKEDG